MTNVTWEMEHPPNIRKRYKKALQINYVLRPLFVAVTLTMLASTLAFSQERKITGRILEFNTQKPIRNANIVISGTTSGTISNHLGFFELVVDSSNHKKIIVSHIGFKTSELLIPIQDRFKLHLEKDYTLLNKVNLVRYPKSPNNEPQAKEGNTSIEKAIEVKEVEALFPGGIDNFYDFMGNSLASEITHMSNDPINVTFTINEMGRATNISVSDSTPLVTAAIIQTLQKMPTWIPASQRENNVAEHFKLPIVRINGPNIIPNDVKDFFTHFHRNLQYPLQARKMGIEGAVYAEFQLDSSGNVLSLKLLSDIGAYCGDEVTRVLSTMPTEVMKTLSHRTNSSRFILPVIFSLSGSFKAKESISNSDAVVLDEVTVTAMKVVSEHVAGRSGAANKPRIAVVSSTIYTYQNLNEALKESKVAKRLSLVECDLNSFPTEISQLTNLEFLDLEKNSITTLPAQIEKLAKLQELYLFENKLENLPGNFGNLKKIKILSLSSNQLKSFPKEIVLLESLEVLDLGNNQLSSIPPEIKRLNNLQVLILQNNNITSFPKEFYGLKNLKKLYLQGNPIDPKEVTLLKKSLKQTEIVFLELKN